MRRFLTAAMVTVTCLFSEPAMAFPIPYAAEYPCTKYGSTQVDGVISYTGRCFIPRRGLGNRERFYINYGANIRSGASMSSAVILSVDEVKRVRVDALEGDWAWVYVDDTYGWTHIGNLMTNLEIE